MNSPEQLGLQLYFLADAAKTLNLSESTLLQYAAFRTTPYDGLKLGVFVVDEVLDEHGTESGRFKIHGILDSMELSSIFANGKIEIPTFQLLARTRSPLGGTMDDEMLQRQPVADGGWTYKYHPKNATVTVTKERISIDGKHLAEYKRKLAEVEKKAESPDWEKLRVELNLYFDRRYDELPEHIREYVKQAFFPCPEYWDGYTLEKRKRQINDYDLKHNPARQIERKAGEWLYSMDANAWWLAESISPTHAAMLLSRRNPNTQKVEDAETNTNDEMGPEDFRRLKNTFDGASNKQKTLKDWIAYARDRSLKIHSWICDWEAWVREVDAKAIEQSRQGWPAIPEELARVAGKKAESPPALSIDRRLGAHPPGQKQVSGQANGEWMIKAQEFAKEYIDRHKAQDLFPSQSDVCTHVETKMREMKIYGAHGKPVSAQYIQRNAIQGDWWKRNKP